MADSTPFAQDAFSGDRPLDPQDRLDEGALHTWMSGHVEGYSGLLRVRRFKGGQSNPTYRLDAGGRSYVLRRKPFGKLLPSAHAVEREYKVTRALYAAGFPAPRALALCEDTTIVGSAFYVMEHVDGRVFWNAVLPEVSSRERHEIYCAQVDVLAHLHQLSPEKLGLGDYGRPGSYFVRQVERWTKQYRASETEVIPAMEHLIEWLPRTVPEQTGRCVVHGDFRLDNMIFAPHDSRVLAVIDWELSTLGDPLADLSYLLMNWIMPADGRSALGGIDTDALGIPGAKELAERYCRVMGWRRMPALEWYFAFNLFRLVGIMQGIAKRVLDGTAASAEAARVASRAAPLAEQAWSIALKTGAHSAG